MSRPSPRPTHTASSLHFRSARPTDGASLWRLVQATGALEPNTPYAYLLLASDFGSTCLVAEQDGHVLGAVMGYHPPEQPRTAFVWQVGLMPALRGKGLGVELLQRWIALPANRQCEWVTATVADDNTASQALFKRFAAQHGAPCEVRPHFTADLFPMEHPAEPLYRIGPLQRTVAEAEPQAEPADAVA
jgi:L-2,4-diaminobutyric acid acetyltransferase